MEPLVMTEKDYKKDLRSYLRRAQEARKEGNWIRAAAFARSAVECAEWLALAQDKDSQ